MKIHKINGLLTSLYLVVYPRSKKLLLLDSGCAGDFNLIYKKIKSLGYSHHNLTLITTHAHSDHMGSAHKWKELGVPILAPKEINNWYSGYWGSFMKRVDTSLGRYVYSISNNINYPGLHALSELLFTSKLFHYPKYLDADFLDISLFNNKKTIISNDFRLGSYSCTWTHFTYDIFVQLQQKIFYASDALVVLNKELKFPIPVDFPMLQSDRH